MSLESSQTSDDTLPPLEQDYIDNIEHLQIKPLPKVDNNHDIFLMTDAVEM